MLVIIIYIMAAFTIFIAAKTIFISINTIKITNNTMKTCEEIDKKLDYIEKMRKNIRWDRVYELVKGINIYQYTNIINKNIKSVWCNYK